MRFASKRGKCERACEEEEKGNAERTPRRGSGAGKIEKDRIDRSNYLAKSATEENRYERDSEALSWKILRHETQSSVPLVPLN